MFLVHLSSPLCLPPSQKDAWFAASRRWRARRAAVVLQALCRMLSARRAYRATLVAAAALRAAWRYALAVRRFAAAASRVQRAVRRWAARARRERRQEAALALAVGLQAAARGGRARCAWRAAARAAVALQTWRRAAVGRRRAQQQRRAEAAMAAFWRGSRERRAFQGQRRATCKLQVPQNGGVWEWGCGRVLRREGGLRALIAVARKRSKHPLFHFF